MSQFPTDVECWVKNVLTWKLTQLADNLFWVNYSCSWIMNIVFSVKGSIICTFVWDSRWKNDVLHERINRVKMREKKMWRKDFASFGFDSTLDTLCAFRVACERLISTTDLYIIFFFFCHRRSMILCWKGWCNLSIYYVMEKNIWANQIWSKVLTIVYDCQEIVFFWFPHALLCVSIAHFVVVRCCSWQVPHTINYIKFWLSFKVWAKPNVFVYPVVGCWPGMCHRSIQI